MNFLRYLLALLAMAAVPAVAFAQFENGPHATRPLSVDGVLLSGVACNAGAPALTWTSSAGEGHGYGVLGLQLNLTWNAASVITVTCSVSGDNQTTWAQLQVCDNSTVGTCALTDAKWTKAVSASKNYPFRVDFLGFPDARCVVSCTGGGASDIISLYGYEVSK